MSTNVSDDIYKNLYIRLKGEKEMAYIEGEIPVNTGNNGATLAYPVMPYMPYGGMGGYGNGFGFGGDAIWIIALLALMGGWGGGFGGFGGFGGGLGLADGGLLGYAIGNNATKGDLSDGFNSLHLSNQIEGVRDGVASLSNQLCNTGNSITNAINSTAYNAEISANNRAINQMQDTFALSRQLCDCCGENRLATADLKYTIATEECATRNNASMNTRDIIESQNRGTQAILDKLNAQTLEAKNDEIAQLRQEILFARGQASQIAQNEQIVNSIYNRLDQCPVGTTPVFGRTPIFTCPNNNGCGCGSIQ